MGRYRLAPMTEACAAAITAWRYRPPFTLYDLQPGDETMLLDPALNYHAVLDERGELAGFACFGEDAQVIGGEYRADCLDIGFGMAPERVGRGDGCRFVDTICRHAWETLEAGCLRLSVATFNHPAIRVYRRLGFRTVHWFIGTTRHGSLSFMTMTRARGGL